MQHSDDRSTFVVRNIVKNFVNLSRMSDRHFDGVGIFQAVELKCTYVGLRNKLGPDVVLGEQVFDTEELHK